MEFGGKDDRVSAMRMKRRDSMAAVKEKGSENVNDAANTWASQVAVNKVQGLRDAKTVSKTC
jgi:hypothetical protein